MKKTAVVLLNLGGPNGLKSVGGFLFNLFYDRAIVDLPNPFRWVVAKFIALSRANKAKEIYASIGGKSPILEQTKTQARTLEKKLIKKGHKFKVFVAMRYWHPFSHEVIADIRNFRPEEILLIPLYPQFSTTTTKSSIDDFSGQLKGTVVKSLCCYYNDPKFIRAHVEQIQVSYELAKQKHEKIKLLFSAHSLPIAVIEKGDPYQWQVEQTVKLIMEQLKEPALESEICYQSKVGSMEWLQPSAEDAIKRTCTQGFAVIMVPISFVSEHSETLYELDILYKELAIKYRAKGFYRVKALATNDLFIDCLADMTMKLADFSSKNSLENAIMSNSTRKNCPKEFCCCINKEVYE